MDRTSAPNFATNSLGHRIYQDRNLSTGQAGTELIAADRTAIQEEIMSVIEAAGLVGNAGALQLLTALQTLFVGAGSGAFLASAGFAYSWGTTGFLKFPASLGGLILNWWTGAADPADNTEPIQAAVWAEAFPNGCFGAVASTNIASATTTADDWYQLVGSAASWGSGVTVQRQHGTTSTGFSVATTPFVVAFGH